MKWQTLVKIVVVGTDRTKIPQVVVEELKALGIEADDPAALILQGAATVGMMTKAGYLPETFEGDLPKGVEKEVAEICGKRAIQYLGGLIKSGKESILVEFLKALQAHKKILPTESLPFLLDMATTSKKIWPFLKPIIGKRGIWLLHQNENWKTLDRTPQLTDWEDGHSTDRASYLEYIRQEDSARGLALLVDTWSTENTTVRKKLLPTLKIGLSISDESFLAKCLNEKSKEICKIAQNLLSLIPNSAFNQRMKTRLTQLIQMQGNGEAQQLNINLPRGIDDKMIRDGIRASVKLYRSGQKASQLAQMINRLPLAFWSSLTTVSPEQTLRLMAASEYGEMLLPAVADAAAHHQDQNWMQVILSFWVAHYEEKKWQHFSPVHLIPLLDEAGYNTITLAAFPDEKNFPAEHTPVDLLLQSAAHRWNADLSRQFFTQLKKYLTSPYATHWGGWHIRKILKVAGYQALVDLYPEWRKGWPEHLPVWGGWEREVIGCMETIQLRYRMIKAIREGN